MISIKISDTDACAGAADWCKSNINKWKLDFEFGSITTYIFQFTDPRDATVFALRWVQ
jgi:hypothetical protein